MIASKLFFVWLINKQKPNEYIHQTENQDVCMINLNKILNSCWRSTITNDHSPLKWTHAVGCPLFHSRLQKCDANVRHKIIACSFWTFFYVLPFRFVQKNLCWYWVTWVKFTLEHHALQWCRCLCAIVYLVSFACDYSETRGITVAWQMIMYRVWHRLSNSVSFHWFGFAFDFWLAQKLNIRMAEKCLCVQFFFVFAIFCLYFSFEWDSIINWDLWGCFSICSDDKKVYIHF